MASPHVFRSSPSRHARRESGFVISSSPELPPLKDMLSQKPKQPAIRSGSRAAPIPPDATTTFTSASQLWKAAQAEAATASASTAGPGTDDIVTDGDAKSPGSVVEVTEQVTLKPKKPRQKGKTRVDNSRPKTPLLDSKPASPAKDQPWKKYKSNQDHVAQQTSKTSDRDDHEALSQQPASDMAETSRHFKESTPHSATPEKRPTNKKQRDTLEPLQLEPALARRVDWTPPAEKACIILDSDPTEHDASSQDLGPTASVFSTLLDTYGCKDATQPRTEASASEDSGDVVKKRRLIDPATTIKSATAETRETSPTKQKAPRKKARTITELATAAYRVADDSATEPMPASVLDYFADGGAESGASKEGTAGKGKGKAKARKKPAKTTRKKAGPPKPILLSPHAALKQVANQDYVFGTSSQLAGEHSPSFLRDLHAAMRNSNQFEGREVVTPINSDAIEPTEMRKKLWDAGARDEDGDLFDVQVVDLVDVPSPAQAMNKQVDPFGYVKAGDDNMSPAAVVDSVPVVDDDSFVDLSDILPPPAPASETTNQVCLIESSLSADRASASTNIRPAPLAQPLASISLPPADAEMQEVPPAKSASSSDSTDASRPHFDLYTDAQLSKEIASYGFKPVKRRNGMIALLDQCWQSKTQTHGAGVRAASTQSTAKSRQRAAASASSVDAPAKRQRGRPRKNSASPSLPDAQEPPPSAQPQESPKRGRGRPRKDAGSPSKEKAAKAAKKSASPARKKSATTKPTPATPPKRTKKQPAKRVIEIADSASESGGCFSPSSRSTSPDQTFSPGAPVDLSLSMEEDSVMPLTLSPTEQQAVLYEHIFKAVTTAPRTTDPSNPSWHEKILLYDPIVLEDLTAWLNGGQLTRVGFDEEVSAGEVKKWCESKSICCFWKVNLRGKERKRY